MTTFTQRSTMAAPARYTGDGGVLTASLQQLYSVFLWDLDRLEIPGDTRLDPAQQRLRAEFFFNVPPKSIETTEPFTTRVTPTQNGGKFIESHGSIFKDIRIQGTTGLRPKKAAPSQVPLFNPQPFSTLAAPFQDGLDFFTEVRTIPEDEVTGFDDIHFLRNIFRKYSDLKAAGQKVVMVWRNIKDDDYWICEPKEFRLSQSSKSPLTYEYSISLQGVSPFDAHLAAVSTGEDPQAQLRDITRFVSRVQEYNQAIANSFAVISTNISRLKGLGFFATDTILGPLVSVIRGIATINNTTAATAASLRNQIVAARDNVRAAVDQLDAQFDALDKKIRDGLVSNKRRPNRQDDVVRELRRLTVIFARLLTERPLQDTVASTASTRRTTAVGAYGTRPIATGLSGTGSTSTGVAEDTVGAGETIRDLALRLLGDGRRWYELALLNDLRAPYTSTIPRPGALAPGDKILYPTNNPTDTANTLPVNMTDDEVASTAEYLAAQSFGRDLRLTSTQLNDLAVTDVAINQQGDIATIVGVPNVEQAIRIKFSTEVGELPAHPGFGARYAIGSKATLESFNTFRLNVLATLRSDARVVDVEKLKFITQEDILYVNAVVELRNTRDYLSTNFALRRF